MLLPTLKIHTAHTIRVHHRVREVRDTQRLAVSDGLHIPTLVLPALSRVVPTGELPITQSVLFHEINGAGHAYQSLIVDDERHIKRVFNQHRLDQRKHLVIPVGYLP